MVGESAVAGAEVVVLGPVGVRIGGRVAVPSAEQARTLLGALALAGAAGLSGPALAEAIWPEDTTSRHRTSLPVAVHRVRRWLREVAEDAVAIESTGSGYRLAGAVDADRFRRLVAAGQESAADGEARIAALAAALALWRDDPLAGTQVPPGLEAAVDGLHRTRIAAAVRYGRLLVAAGRPAEAADVLLPVAGQHPLDEHLQGALIEALAAAGRQAEALDRYERLRLRLADELGVDPGRELSETLVRVLRQNLPPATSRPAAPTGVPAQLPPAVAGFVGRDGPLAELDALRRAGDAGGSVVISALDGLGGIGKTALAVQWAHRVAGGYPDGQLYVDLRGYAATDPVRPVEVLGRFLRALGVPADQVPAGTGEAAARYRSLVAGRRMLILLDNAADADQVRPLLPGTPTCLVLVTSRARLDGLLVREGARQLTLRVLDTAEAVELLASVAGGERVAAAPVAAAELVALCGYLPLALRIVGAQLAADPAMTLAAQVAALREDRWAELALPADPGLSVRATFDLSYASLDPADQRLFRLLGLAPGPDIAPAAVAALAGQPVRAAERALRRLVTAHLVDGGDGRYSLHDLVAEYARDRAEPADHEAVRELCRWYLATAQAAGRRLYPSAPTLLEPGEAGAEPLPFPDDDAAQAWLDAERATLSAVAAHAATHGPYDVAWHLIDSHGRALRTRGDLPATLALGEDALAAAERAGDPRGAALAHRYVGQARQDQEGPAAAFEHLEKSLAAARTAGWVTGESLALNGLAAARAMSGDVAGAVEPFRAVIEHSRTHGLTDTARIATANLSVALRTLGRLPEALEHNEALREWHRGTAGDELVALGNRAEIYLDLGRLAEAEQTAGRARIAAQRAGNRLAEGNIRHIAARIRLEEGEPEQARTEARAALDVALDMGHRWLEAEAETVLAEADLQLGADEEARAHLGHALELSAATRHVPAEVRALLALARLDGQPEPAQRALAIAHERGYRVLEADALSTLALLHRHAHDQAAATTHAERALALYRDCGAALRESRIWRLLADIEQAPAPES
ncbi:MAG: ATP-binding protein [Mycobacteriales bacterium]